MVGLIFVCGAGDGLCCFDGFVLGGIWCCYKVEFLQGLLVWAVSLVVWVCGFWCLIF